MPHDPRARWIWRDHALAVITAHTAALDRRRRQPERDRLCMFVHAVTDAMRSVDADGIPYGEATDASLSAFCAGTDRKYVRKGMDDLQALGLVQVDRRGAARTTRYRAVLAEAGCLPPTDS